MAGLTPEARVAHRVRTQGLTPEHLAGVAPILQRQLAKIPAQIAKLEEDRREITAWLVAGGFEVLGAEAADPASVHTCPDSGITTEQAEAIRGHILNEGGYVPEYLLHAALKAAGVTVTGAVA